MDRSKKSARMLYEILQGLGCAEDWSGECSDGAI